VKTLKIQTLIFCLLLLSGILSTNQLQAQEASDVIVISAADIKAMNVHQITDVLNQIPGLNAGATSVSIRGSNKVLVLLDGRPINDPTSSHGGIKFDLVFLENIERIEIYRGKGGVKYGDNASGGVILIYSRKIDTFNGNCKTYAGNYGTFSIRSNCQARTENLGYTVSAGYDETDGYQTNNDKEKTRAGARVSYSPTTDNNFDLALDYVVDKRGLAGRISYPTPFARKKNEMSSTSLTAELKRVTIETFYNWGENENRDQSRDFHNTTTVNQVGQDISSAFSFANWGDLHYGGTWRWQQAESTRFSKRDENWFSLFGILTKTLDFIPLTLALGLRSNFYSEFDNTLNPELKLSWTGKFDSKKPEAENPETENLERGGLWTVAFSYSRVNNIPSMYQRYDETVTKLPNPGLDSETADNFNLSFFLKLGERFSGGISFYYNLINDRITYVWSDNHKGSYENFGKVTYKGVDLNLKFKLLKQLSLKATYAYLKAINEENGNWMAAKPRHRIFSDLIWQPLPTFSAILNIKYESKQYTRSDNREYAPARTIANLRLKYYPLWAKFNYGQIEFFSEIKNLTDKEYLYGDGGLAPPLTWMSGLNIKF